MLCQCCSRNTATTRVKAIVGGELREYMLCTACAQRMGYGRLFGISPGSLLGGFLKNLETSSEPFVCPACEITFEEVARTGRVGCAHCYQAFYDKLIPAIQRIHGNTVHRGKSPERFHLREKGEPTQLAVLQEKLQKAVEKQEYERAAELRDRIRELERQGHAHE